MKIAGKMILCLEPVSNPAPAATAAFRLQLRWISRKALEVALGLRLQAFRSSNLSRSKIRRFALVGVLKRVLVTATVLLLTHASFASAITPEESCAAAKNNAAGRYALCRQKAESKAIRRMQPADYSRCDAILIAKWARAEQRAAAAGTSCLDGVSDTDILLFVGEQVDAIATALGGSAALPIPSYTAFGPPEPVTIIGYSGSAMEPFVSRDGNYLFFNDNGSDKDIFYASRVDDTTFQFKSAITAINTPAVDGVPTMDAAGTFFYVSTANYDPPFAYDTIYRGFWNGSTVTGASPVTGLAITTPGMINFDVEVSPDGSTLYFNDGDFTGGNSFPDTSNIAIAVDSGGGFARHPDSTALMAKVNTADLEYAPAISADGLELFFTRFDPAAGKTAIYRAIRSDTENAFGTPQLVSAITGFVEAPAFSPDEKSLYFHKLNVTSGLFEIQRVTRPKKGVGSLFSSRARLLRPAERPGS